MTRMSLDIPREDFSKSLKDFLIPPRMFQVRMISSGVYSYIMRPSTPPLEMGTSLHIISYIMRPSTSPLEMGKSLSFCL